MRTITAPPRTMAGVASGVRGLGYGVAGGAVIGAFGALAVGDAREIIGWLVGGALIGGLAGLVGGMLK